MKKIFVFLSLLCLLPFSAFAESYHQEKIIFHDGIGHIAIQGHDVQIRNAQNSGLYQVRCFYHQVNDDIHLDSYIILKSHALRG